MNHMVVLVVIDLPLVLDLLLVIDFLILKESGHRMFESTLILYLLVTNEREHLARIAKLISVISLIMALVI